MSENHNKRPIDPLGLSRPRSGDYAHTFILMAATLLATNAVAQDRNECFSELTRTNVCEYARVTQRTIAAWLPMQLNANIILSTPVATGPRIILTANWHLRKSDVDNRLRQVGMTIAELEASLSETTRNAVCSDATMAAFVRLGGTIEFVYRTEDGHDVLSPTVEKC